MAVDLQVVFPQETVKIDNVSVVPNTSPVVIQIFGDDFTAVDIIEVNEIESPSFSIADKHKLFATLPSGISPEQVRTITVTSKKLVLTNQSFFRFRLSKVPAKVSGILKLAQLFVKVLFTTPGSDIFVQNLGGGGLRNLGRSFSSNHTGSIVSDFLVSVQNTVRQILSIQSQRPGLPAEEKILNARVVASVFSAQEGALRVTVELFSQSGNSALVNLVI